MTILNPVLPAGYPPQLVLTRVPDLTEPAFANTYGHTAPEAWIARAGSDWAARKAAWQHFAR